MAKQGEIKVGGKIGTRAGVPPGPTADISGGLQALAVGLGQAAEVFHQNDINRDNIQSVKLQSEYRRRYDEQTAGFDPLSATYQKDIEDTANGLREELSGNAEFTTAAVQENFSLRMASMVEGDITLAAGQRRKSLGIEAVAERGRAEDEALTKIRSDPDGAQLYLDEFNEAAKALASSIAPDKLREMSEAFVDRSVAATVEGLALSGRIDEARATLKENEKLLSPQGVRQLGRRITEIKNLGVANARAKAQVTIADIKVAITDAEDTSVLDVTRARIEAMDAAGEFPGPLQQTRAQLIAKVEAKRDSLMNGSNKLANALRQRDAGTLHKQSDVDLSYKHEQEFLPRDAEGNIDQRAAVNHLVDFASETGRMPSEQKAFIKNAEAIEDETQLAVAAILDKRIHDQAPEVDTGSGARVAQVQAYMTLMGMDAGTAARRAIDKVPDKATLKTRQEAYKETHGPAFQEGVIDFIQGEVADRGFLAQLFTSEPEVDPELRERAEAMFRLAYTETGDEDVAKEIVKNRLQRESGMSEVGRSDRKMTMFPVERHYFPSSFARELEDDPDTKVRIVNAEVEEALRRFNVDLPAPPPGLEDRPRYELRADNQTRKDLATGQQPSWELRVRDEFGTLVPLRVQTDTGEMQIVRVIAPTAEEIVRMPVVSEIMAERVAAAELASARLQMKPAASLEEARERFPFRIPSKGGKAIGGQRVATKDEITPVGDDLVAEPEDEIGGITRVSAPVPNAEEKRAQITKDPAKAATRGLKNNNPGNIRIAKGVTWQGQSKKGTDKEFVTFSEAKFGIRAMAVVLKTYRRKHDIKTIDALVNRWAPTKENNTAAYIKSVVKRTGYSAKQQLNFSDEAVLKKVVKALIHHENGTQPFTEEEIIAGIKLS